jgi:hypothetical protein
MLVRVKSLVIVFLIMSLSIVPSVNASSDIFDEPVHLSYNDLKDRMIDYIETPNYLKPSTAPIIGKNEYVDLSDIILASEDLLTVLPNINDNTFKDISKTSTFKTMNNIVSDILKEVVKDYDPVPENIEYYLNPYVRKSGINNIQFFKDYTKIAKTIQDVIHDNVILRDNDIPNPHFDRSRTVSIDGYTYTVDELFNRVNTGRIMADGTYKFSDTTPLASQGARLPGAPDIVGPGSVNVNDVGNFLSNNYVTTDGGYYNNIIVDNAIKVIDVYARYDGIVFPNLDIRSGEQFAPRVLMDNNDPVVIRVQRDDYAVRVVKDAELRIINHGECPLDIKPETIEVKKTDMGIRDDMLGVYNKVKETDVVGTYSVFEAGLMFVFAIITLVLAFVYR